MAYNGAGIYGIYNVVDNRIYIGKSTHIHNRLSSHRSCFNRKIGNSIMYKEPIEKFVFFVILKMSDMEYQQYGDFFESIFIIQARETMGLYNSSKSHDSALTTVLYFFKVRENIRYGIREATGGVEPYVLKTMKKTTREEFMQRLNMLRKWDED